MIRLFSPPSLRQLREARRNHEAITRDHHQTVAGIALALVILGMAMGTRL